MNKNLNKSANTALFRLVNFAVCFKHWIQECEKSSYSWIDQSNWSGPESGDSKQADACNAKWPRESINAVVRWLHLLITLIGLARALGPMCGCIANENDDVKRQLRQRASQRHHLRPPVPIYANALAVWQPWWCVGHLVIKATIISAILLAIFHRATH